MMPRRHIILMGLILLADAVFTSVMYQRLPERVPTHYGLDGQPDAYGPRLELALVAPAISAVGMVLLVLLPRLGPMRGNFDRFRVIYGRIGVTILGAFGAIHVVLVLKSAGAAFNVGSALCALIGGMIALLGNWMSKVKRNFYVGIRTPWTLASEEVWRRTHRRGARVMVAAGAGAVIAGIAAPPVVALAVLIGGLVGAVAWSLVYSYVIYHKLGGVDDLAPAPPAGGAV